MRFFLVLAVLAAVVTGLVCGIASAASPWFSGYLNPANDYRYYAYTDWDTPLFGGGIQPDSSVFGASPPAYRVDGHVVFEADGTGFATAIESTGSYATHPGLSVGSIQPVSFQFSNWFSSPGFPPVSDTRGDHDANFLNIVSGLIPEPGSIVILAFGALALAGRRR